MSNCLHALYPLVRIPLASMSLSGPSLPLAIEPKGNARIQTIKLMNNKLSKRLALLAVCGFAVSSAVAVQVDLELALLVDVSGSVNTTEYNLQKTGYVNAFNDAAVQAAIASRPGGIAVTYIEWSGTSQQSVRVGWTHLTDAASSSAFASAIAGTTRAYNGSTAPGSAINFAVPLFNNTFVSARQVIDVSGDGSENVGANTAAARDAAVAAGIRINGLPIGGGTGLETWYANNIVGGGGFLLPASSFNTFEAAIRTKIGAEVSNQNPVPDGGSSLLLCFLGLGSLILVRRKI